mmetsp:Transcript_8261/g.13823  ORF Transcript_8261/g.13823 Transcript_8261/m.13823 type:complete len:232 (-) Transcript_8261:199-894(-)
MRSAHLGGDNERVNAERPFESSNRFYAFKQSALRSQSFKKPLEEVREVEGAAPEQRRGDYELEHRDSRIYPNYIDTVFGNGEDTKGLSGFASSLKKSMLSLMVSGAILAGGMQPALAAQAVNPISTQPYTGNSITELREKGPFISAYPHSFGPHGMIVMDSMDPKHTVGHTMDNVIISELRKHAYLTEQINMSKLMDTDPVKLAELEREQGLSAMRLKMLSEHAKTNGIDT